MSSSDDISHIDLGFIEECACCVYSAGAIGADDLLTCAMGGFEMDCVDELFNAGVCLLLLLLSSSSSDKLNMARNEGLNVLIESTSLEGTGFAVCELTISTWDALVRVTTGLGETVTGDGAAAVRAPFTGCGGGDVLSTPLSLLSSPSEMSHMDLSTTDAVDLEAMPTVDSAGLAEEAIDIAGLSLLTDKALILFAFLSSDDVI